MALQVTMYIRYNNCVAWPWILLVDSSHVILLQFCILNLLDNQPEIYGMSLCSYRLSPRPRPPPIYQTPCRKLWVEDICLTLSPFCHDSCVPTLQTSIWGPPSSLYYCFHDTAWGHSVSHFSEHSSDLSEADLTKFEGSFHLGHFPSVQ